MKSIFFKLGLAPALLAAAFMTHSANAETTVNVPFNFTVAGQFWPAGTYTVAASSAESFVTLRSKDTTQSFTWNVGPGDPEPTDRRVILSFHRQRASYALQAVQFGDKTTPRLGTPQKRGEKLPSAATEGQ